MKQYEAVIETLKKLGRMCYIRPVEPGGVQDRGLPMEDKDSVCIHSPHCAGTQGNFPHPARCMGAGRI